uniref:BPTI/Kunitz inhibitor domain-containing protein n=1 Tax=Amblyomma tuberculatum TaxID=48802 RepID=A0A6M2E3J8_9ACAR
MTWILLGTTIFLVSLFGCSCFEEDPAYMQCTQYPDRGPCKGRVYRYYFNFVRGTCRLFVYGGCEGNTNNFKRRTECLRRCANVVTSRICKLPADGGYGYSRVWRYYFDPKTQSCRAFVYQGFGGNRNNFISSDECRMQCLGKEAHERGED